MLSPKRLGTRISALTTRTQHSTKSSRQCNKAIKRNTRHIDYKEINKIVLIYNDIIVYTENTKESPKTLIEPISDTTVFTNKKSFVFLYTSSNEHLEAKIKNTIPITITHKKKYLNVNL